MTSFYFLLFLEICYFAFWFSLIAHMSIGFVVYVRTRFLLFFLVNPNRPLGTDLTKSTWCHLKRGEAEMHSAWTLHRSDPNTSDRRRCAWIVRYCPTGTRVVPGMRDSFPADYNIVPVRGKGALSTAPNAVLNDGCSGCNVDGDVQARRYAPCFGGKAVKAFNV